MSTSRRRPSLLGGFLWTGLGTVFLLESFHIGPDLWTMIGRYWPILLILLGLGKVIDYFRQKEGVSLRIGEVFVILLVLVIGSALSRIPDTAVGDMLWTHPIRIGDTDLTLGNSYSYTEEASYPLTPGTPVYIENTNGDVTVTPGSEGELRVRLKKVIYEEDAPKAEEIARRIALRAGMRDAAPAVFTVRTNRDEFNARDYRFNTNLEVFVPRKADLRIRNSFGAVSVSNLDGRLELETSHRPLEVRDCTGSFTVSNRYARTRLVNLTGDVDVDSRGDVYAERIRGDVKVRDEYSAVETRNIEGKLTVDNLEGRITIRDVSKPVVVNARGSEVSVRDLSDTLKITTSHQRVEVWDVASNVTLGSRYARVTMRRIKGNVDVQSNSDRLDLEDLSGYLKTTAQGSSLRVNSVRGPVDIATTLKDVVVKDFEGSCKVVNEYGDVRLDTGPSLSGEINVRDRNGEIALFLPDAAPFRIDAVARNGRVATDFSDLQTSYPTSDTAVLRGERKSSGPRISLETEYSNIRVNVRERGNDRNSN